MDSRQHSPCKREYHPGPGDNLIAPGSRGEFDWGLCYAAPPLVRSEEALFYYWGVDGEHYSPHNASFGLATMRAGRYAGARRKPARAGHGVHAVALSSVELQCAGSVLVVTADTCSRVGCPDMTNVTVSVVGHSSLVDTVRGSNVTDHAMGFDLSPLVGSQITLRFELSGGASLFSFGFAK